MKALLTTFGTDGDNHPFIAIALALRDRGHEPVLMLNPYYEEKVVQHGLRFIPLGERWHIDQVDKEKYANPLNSGPAIIKDFYVPRIEADYHAMHDAIAREQPDVVVSHFFCYGATWAARAAQVPTAVVTLAPGMWIAYDSPPIFSPWRPPMWSRRPLLRVFRALLNSLFRRWLNGPAAALAVPKRRDWYFANFADATINLGMWSAAFSPAPADAPPRHVLSGFPIIADDGSMAALPDELRTFLEAGTPPVVVGLGTSARDVGGPIYRAAAEACEQLGERCLLIGPKSREGLPLSAFVVRSAPYVPVFAKARAVLHHGGVNTTAETLRAGLPSIVVPFAADQYDNAERVERLGVGRMIRQGRATKAELASALRHLLAPAIVERARLLGGQLRAEGDGARRAVTALETLIPPRSPGAFRAAHPSGRMDS